MPKVLSASVSSNNLKPKSYFCMLYLTWTWLSTALWISLHWKWIQLTNEFERVKTHNMFNCFHQLRRCFLFFYLFLLLRIQDRWNPLKLLGRRRNQVGWGKLLGNHQSKRSWANMKSYCWSRGETAFFMEFNIIYYWR